ncbi:MAG: 2-oxo acid dehydrogenase subunit E2, partial [Winogradskyella sp.]|nr:2-oxo acid dehydrogenase subunit E2 [Winogradskyella sp.]
MSKVEFKMPKLGESITEAAIITWFKKVGDTVEEDEMLLEEATDKVDSEVPSNVSGTIEEILFQPNDVIKIGETIAIINSDGVGSTSKTKAKTSNKTPHKTEIKKSSKEKETKTTQRPKPLVNTGTETSSVSNTNQFFSPLIISIAKEHHISFEELARIPATGAEGRLRKSDLFQYIDEGRPYKFAQPVSQPDPTAYRIPQLTFDKGKGKIIEMDRMRQMIADHMVYSKHTSPHVTAYVEADMTNIVNWRNANKKAFLDKYGEKLTFTPLFVEAVAKAIKDFPNINASVDGKNIIVKEDINIG